MFSRVFTKCICALDGFANERTDRFCCFMSNVVCVLPSFERSLSGVLPCFLTDGVGVLHSFSNSGTDCFCCLVSDAVCVFPGLHRDWTDVFASLLTEAVQSLPGVIKPARRRCDRCVVLTVGGEGEGVKVQVSIVQRARWVRGESRPSAKDEFCSAGSQDILTLNFREIKPMITSSL